MNPGQRKDSMNRTKESALTETRSLWRWLKRNPPKPKAAWPHLKKREWPGWKCQEPYVNYCPCCEYATDATGFLNCSRCPLTSLWGATPEACCKDKSPYKEWMKGNSMAKNAQIIVNACTRELETLRGKK